MDTVLIMAAGTHERFPGVIKQLMYVGEESIIGRTVRQVNEREREPWIVTHEQYIIDEFQTTMHEIPYRRDCLLASILSTHRFWDNRMTVLLGDVVYTDAALDTIFADHRYPAFFGNKRDIFALVFDDCEGMARTIGDTISAGGKTLWHLYYTIIGVFPTRKYVYKNEWPMIEINDGTDDVDTPQGYADLLKRWPQGVK